MADARPFGEWLYARLRELLNSTDLTPEQRAAIEAALRDLDAAALGAGGSSPEGLMAWVQAMFRGIVAAWNAPDLSPTVSFLTAEGESAFRAIDVSSLAAFYKDISENPSNFIDSAIDAPELLIAKLVHIVTGLTIPPDIIKTMITGASTEEVRQKLGQIVKTLYDETLRTEGVAEEYRNRNPGDAGWTVFKSLIGASMRIQVGDLLVSWAGKKIPYGLASVFTEIAEKLDKAIGLEDAIEEVVQVPMQALIQRALESYYNRILKPVDLTAGEVRQARIAGRISDADYGKILDNMGYRDDVRDMLLDFAATNLTESDINDAYQWGLIDRNQVKEEYKNKYYNENDRELKTKLVEMTRRQKLREKILELYGNLYRDGVATKDEVRPFLQNYGFDNDEIDMWFAVQELERRQRKWISDGNLIKLITNGERTTTEAIQYLVLQGMEVNDAASLISLAVKAEKEAEVESIERQVKATITKLPKAVRDKCDDLFKPEDILGDLLAKLISLIPSGLGDVASALKLKDLIECALKNLGTTPPPGP